MESGVMAYIEEKLKAVVGIVDRLYAEGKLKEWAESFGQSILAAFKSAYEGAIGFLKAVDWIYNRFQEVRLLIDQIVHLWANAMSSITGGISKVTGWLAQKTASVPGLSKVTGAAASAAGAAAGVAETIKESSAEVLGQHWTQYETPSIFEKAAEGMEAFKGAVNEAQAAVEATTESTAQFFDYAAAASGKDPFVVEPKIKKSPVQPWASGIQSMQDDLADLGGMVQSSLDLGGVASLISSIQSTINAAQRYGPIGGYQSSRSVWAMYGGSEKEAYGHTKELLSLQMNLLKQYTSGTGGGGGRGGGVVINLGGVTIYGGGSAEQLTKQLDEAVAKEIKYGRSRILQELQAQGLS